MAPELSTLPVNSRATFSALIVTSFVEYIAPPKPSALLKKKSVPVRVKLPVLYIAPPFALPLLLKNSPFLKMAMPAFSTLDR